MVRRALAALLLVLLTAGAAAEFRASVDRRVVDENDVVVLELARDAQVFVGNPDLTALEDDFRVLGTQRSSQFTIINGRTRSLTTWSVTLQPKRRGTLRIPPIEYDGERTQPITVTVTQPSPEEVKALSRTVFFETEVGKGALWVQEQVLYTVRLYYAADAVLFGDLPPPPNVTEAVVQALGDSRPDVEVRDGVRYNVIEQRYAVIPQRSGTLVIPPETFSGAVRIADRGATRRKNIRITSDGHRVPVKPQPADWPVDAPWLPARELMLTQRWDPSPRLTAGDPVTRTLEIVARGIAASALPKLPEVEIPGANTYTNQPVLDEGMAVGDFIASRIESTVIIPERAGRLELPEVRVPWFDVERGEVRMAVIPAQRLTVAAGSGGTAATPPGTPEVEAETPAPIAVPAEEQQVQEASPAPVPAWPRFAAVFAMLLLAVLAIWWFRRSSSDGGLQASSATRAETPTTEAALRSRLRAACDAGDAVTARRVAAHWRGKLTLDAERRGEFDALIAALDRAVYGGDNEPWDGKALARFAATYRDPKASDRDDAAGMALPPLHPTA